VRHDGHCGTTATVANGEISPDEGAVITQLLEARARIISEADLERRIEAIEQRLGEGE